MKAPAPESPEFAEEALPAIRLLCQTLEELLAQVPDASEAGPTQLGRLLKIDTKLAWRVTNMVAEEDPFQAALYVPRTAGMRLVLKAFAKKGAVAPSIDRARRAGTEFEAMVKRHAGDRRSAEILFAGHVAGAGDKAILEQRRNAFHANSTIWGIQARAQAQGTILLPSADPTRFDVAMIRGFHELTSLRPNVPWRMNRVFTVRNKAAEVPDMTWEVLEPEEKARNGEAQALPWLRRFCSSPLPKSESVNAPNGDPIFQLAPRSVGSTAAIDCYTGEILRNSASRYFSDYNTSMGFPVVASTPAQHLLLDLWIHDSLRFEFVHPTLTSALFITDALDAVQSDLLPIRKDEIIFQEAGEIEADVDVIPAWGDMMRWCCQSLQVDMSEFRLVRWAIPFPPLPSIPRIEFGFPAAPGEPPASHAPLAQRLYPNRPLRNSGPSHQSNHPK